MVYLLLSKLDSINSFISFYGINKSAFKDSIKYLVYGHKSKGGMIDENVDGRRFFIMLKGRIALKTFSRKELEEYRGR